MGYRDYAEEDRRAKQREKQRADARAAISQRIDNGDLVGVLMDIISDVQYPDITLARIIARGNSK